MSKVLELGYVLISQDKRKPQADVEFSVAFSSFPEMMQRYGSQELRILGVYINIDALTPEYYGIFAGQNEDFVVYYKFADQQVEAPYVSKVQILTPEQEEVIINDIEEPVIQQPTVEQPSEPVVKEPVVEQPTVQKPVVEEKQVVEEKPIAQKPAGHTQEQGITIIGGKDVENGEASDKVKLWWKSLLSGTPTEQPKAKKGPATVYLFGSAKGGTGKTFTCTLTARRFAQANPGLKVAIADYDIADGQLGITVNKHTVPTVANYYKESYKKGDKSFNALEKVKVKNEHFGPNLDFYLAPPLTTIELTRDTPFWVNVMQLLIDNYDVVFFDSGNQYLTEPAISNLYKIADRIILTTTPNINSVTSITKQMNALGGLDNNPVFKKEENILDRVRIAMTRVQPGHTVNDTIFDHLSNYVPIVVAFGDLDKQIINSQYYQNWEQWDEDEVIKKYLDNMVDLEQ